MTPNLRLLTLLVAVLAATGGTNGSAWAQNSGTRTVQGIVRDSESGETLRGASVVIEGTRVAALTNIDGRFTLVGVPLGEHTLVVRSIGYQESRLVLQERGDLALPLIVRLSPAPILLSGVTVTAAGQTQTVDVSQGVSEISLSPAMVSTTPSLGEKDIFRTLQLLPGVSSANKGTSGLYVRGGTPDQNLLLLDGMSMYHVDHFFGIFSAFNVDAIKDIRFYAGGYPAKYGGRVSSVLDLTGKSGDEQNLRGSVGMGFLSGRGVVEVPLGRGSFLLSGRRSYTDLIRTPLYNKLFQSTGATTGAEQTGPQGGPPGRGLPRQGRFQVQTVQPSFYFYDSNAKGSYRPTDKDLLSVSLYGGTDNLDQSNTLDVTFGQGPGGFGPNDDGTGIGSEQTGQIQNVDTRDWGNRGASLRWFRQWVPRLSSDALVATSAYHSNAYRSSSATLGASSGRTGTLGQPSFQEGNTVEDLTFRLDSELLVLNSLNLDFGSWVSRNEVLYDYAQLRADSIVGGLSRTASAVQASAYAQAAWSPLSRLVLTTGVRSTHYDLTGRTYLEPRFEGSFRLTDAIRLKGAWGRYHQFVNRVENEDVLNGSRDFWLLADSTLAPTAAEHRIVGINIDLPMYLLSVEAYDKVLDDIALFSRRFRRVSFAADYNTLFYTGTGRARGIDVLAQKKFGALTGWLSYSLAKGTEQFADVDEGQSFASSQDQRHEFKAVGSYQIKNWTVSSAFVVGSGMPYTSPESQYYLTLLDGSQVGYIHVGDKNGARLPAYHRLDLAMFRRFPINNRFDLEVGASVFNVYDRLNVAYRRFDLSTTPITVTDAFTLGRAPSVDLRLILK